MTRRFRTAARAALLAGLAVVLVAPQVDARPGGGKGSFGSRGSQTYSAPPSTATAPRSAQPMQRTETPNVGAPRPGMPASAAPSRGLGFGGGLMAGLLGAGLLGMLFGGGFMGGLGGLASMLGLLMQVALIGGLIWLALRFFRRRSEPALAGAGAPYARQTLGGGLPGSGGGPTGPARPATTPQPIEIDPQDYKAFERALSEIQISYGRGDLGALRRLATPEMAGYFEQDLAEDRGRGVRNEVSEPKLLQGDLAQAWREGSAEYATVAMRFEIIDVFVDVASGRVVSGNKTAPTEATELWTFRRDNQGPWLLSAIQQSA
ncbi:Tim44 domain-containing protein [uncultured Enterovirga sp.]|uniref:Tim44 domain-containing protein n=1 Tax=uncultured Enterovirga sp. TaxID=2026352 RepID=UPI0035C9FAEA